MWDKSVFKQLEDKLAAAQGGGGIERIEKQHSQGKLTARERLDLLFDPGTFCEVDAFIEGRIDDFGADKKRVPGDGVIIGYGKIDNRLAFAAAEDFTVHGGTMGEYHLKKICRVLDLAYEMRAPYIALFDSGGARIEEGIVSLAELGGVFYRNTRNSGVIPQISAIMGPCAGGACYSPALCDFVFMVRQTGRMFLTGPDVVKTVTGEEVDAEALGGAAVHGNKSGVAHFICEDDKSCLLAVRQLLTYLPENCEASLPEQAGAPTELSKGLQEVVVQDRRKCYDVRAVVGAIIDKQSFLEVHKGFARNVVVGFGRLAGETVGIVANQPNYMGGSLDCHAADKIARFIRFCDCFDIPLITLVDVPAFLPGKEQEQAGVIRHGAKILYAYSEATVPKVTLILRKAYGGAYIAMNSKEMGADLVFAWPIAEIAVMGAEGAVNILWGKKLKSLENPEEERAKRIAAYEEAFMNPYVAAARGYVDEVIRPEDTREKIKGALNMLKGKRGEPPIKKHGNIPL